jgi:hypothetical protein
VSLADFGHCQAAVRFGLAVFQNAGFVYAFMAALAATKPERAAACMRSGMT